MTGQISPSLRACVAVEGVAQCLRGRARTSCMQLWGRVMGRTGRGKGRKEGINERSFSPGWIVRKRALYGGYARRPEIGAVPPKGRLMVFKCAFTKIGC